jgi:hypothetical protein
MREKFVRMLNLDDAAAGGLHQFQALALELNVPTLQIGDVQIALSVDTLSFPLLVIRASNLSCADFVSDLRVTVGMSEAGKQVICSIEIVASGVPANVATVTNSIFARIMQALPSATDRAPSPVDVTVA